MPPSQADRWFRGGCPSISAEQKGPKMSPQPPWASSSGTAPGIVNPDHCHRGVLALSSSCGPHPRVHNAYHFELFSLFRCLSRITSYFLLLTQKVGAPRPFSFKVYRPGLLPLSRPQDNTSRGRSQRRPLSLTFDSSLLLFPPLTELAPRNVAIRHDCAQLPRWE